MNREEKIRNAAIVLREAIRRLPHWEQRHHALCFLALWPGADRLHSYLCLCVKPLAWRTVELTMQVGKAYREWVWDMVRLEEGQRDAVTKFLGDLPGLGSYISPALSFDDRVFAAFEDLWNSVTVAGDVSLAVDVILEIGI